MSPQPHFDPFKMRSRQRKAIHSLKVSSMAAYYLPRATYQLSEFGRWDCNNDLPFTQCFETARHAHGLLRYSYAADKDLYVAGNLYSNDVIAPAVIVVPRKRGKSGYPRTKFDGVEENWMARDSKSCMKSPAVMAMPAPKPVDEDLYKIPAELVHSRPRKKRAFSFISKCLVPVCDH